MQVSTGYGALAMDYSKLKKPEHLKDDTWRQHLDWMDVMVRQLDENFDRHQLRVREDANRARALWELHQSVLNADRRTRSLFNK